MGWDDSEGWVPSSAGSTSWIVSIDGSLVNMNFGADLEGERQGEGDIRLKSNWGMGVFRSVGMDRARWRLTGVSILFEDGTDEVEDGFLGKRFRVCLDISFSATSSSRFSFLRTLSHCASESFIGDKGRFACLPEVDPISSSLSMF